MMRVAVFLALLVGLAWAEHRRAVRGADRPAFARRLEQDAAATLVGAAAFAAVAGWRRKPWGLLLPAVPLAIAFGLKPEMGAAALAMLWPESDARTAGVWLAGAAVWLLARGGGRWRCVLICGAAAFGNAAANGWALKDLPPAYHDEFAYRFQAEGFLAGRVAFPADELTPSFRQMHVLAHEVYACRYFPGMALWLAPFLAAGVPWLAGWVAAAGTAGAVAGLAWRQGRFAGYAAGMLMAVAPGLAAFGNTMLSPTPTMFALAVFAACYGSRRPVVSLVAGAAMGAAFACRPLTAAGIGLPFALHACWRFGGERTKHEAWRFAALVGGYAAVAALLPLHNAMVMGTPWSTPYSRYNDTVTPSHAYGFDNKERGVPRRGPMTNVAYDDWAENLRPAEAPGIVGGRWLQLSAAGVAAPALLWIGWLFVLPFLAAFPLGLLAAGIVGLTLAYLPYWFAGVFGYGYLAEAMPFAAVLAATGWRVAVDFSGAKAALAALLAVRLLANAAGATPELFGPGSELRVARQEHARFAAAEAAALQREKAPLLVLVKADPKTAVHSTLVSNSPGLNGPVVRAWHDDALVPWLLERYPERAAYILEHRGFAQPFGWVRLRGPVGKSP
jgi:hypothetical protein